MYSLQTRAAAVLELRKRKALEPPIWTPQEGAQTLGYTTEAGEVFYGGAAGGGKTDLLLGLAGTQHWRSVIFRRTFTSMRSMIERSREIYNPTNAEHGKDSYNESLHIWRFNDGRIIELSSMQHEKDKLPQKGRPRDLYGFDELPEFTESQYLFATGWLRSVRPGQRCRIVGTGNPPTDIEGEWVIRRWAAWLDPQHSNPANPGELRWYARLDGKDTEVPNSAPFTHKGEEVIPLSRTFIPARLSDNKYLADTNYLAQLQGQPEPYRSQLIYGDFSIRVADDRWQTIPTAWVRAAQKRWLESGRPDLKMRALGIDVARGGKDNNAFAPLYGTWFAELVIVPGVETPDGDQVAAKAIELIDDMDTPIGIDVIGVGTSPYDTLRRGKYQVIGVNNSAGSSAKDKTGRYGFVNIRAESYWKFREALDPASGEDICLPPDRQVLIDLCAPRYNERAGKYAIESKDDIIKRIGHSPDMGDAIVIAWYRANGARKPLTAEVRRYA